MRNLNLMRVARDRATLIREANERYRQRVETVLTFETMRPVPFDELPVPFVADLSDVASLTRSDDDNLEQFLRRNNLTAALAVYLDAQAKRNA